MKTNKLLFLAHLAGCLIVIMNTGCKKDPGTKGTISPPPAVHINPPQVSAVTHIQLVLPADTCTLSATITTTGSKIISHLWEKTYGPAAYWIEQPDSLITKVRGLQEGIYNFQLTVTDSTGLKGRTVVVVSVIAPVVYDYNLDLNINGAYKFFDNVEICPWDCYTSDVTEIAASAQLSYSDLLKIFIYEETDSAAQAHNSKGFTAFRLSNQLYASGTSSFNLKKVMQQGGGAFSGTIQLNSSSALGTSRESAFKALPPLTVTGKLDTTTLSVNIQIKGKIIF